MHKRSRYFYQLLPIFTYFSHIKLHFRLIWLKILPDYTLFYCRQFEIIKMQRKLHRKLVFMQGYAKSIDFEDEPKTLPTFRNETEVSPDCVP